MEDDDDDGGDTGSTAEMNLSTLMETKMATIMLGWIQNLAWTSYPIGEDDKGRFENTPFHTDS